LYVDGSLLNIVFNSLVNCQTIMTLNKTVFN
jgi:hypothetical protein